MVNELYESLQKRLRPEDVAELVLLELKGKLAGDEERLLKKAAKHSLKNLWQQFTSMSQDFYRPVAPVSQTKKAHELFTTSYVLEDEDCADAEKVSQLIKDISGEIRKNFGAGSFKHDRLNGAQRAERGLDISRRRYNKLFRFLANFEAKIETYKRELRKYRATRIAKSGLATDIDYEDFASSKDAACFIAYYSARANRRSVFTNQSQDKAYDEVAEMLLSRFRRNPLQEGWRAIAFVMPDANIVDQLFEEDKILLYGKWFAVLADIAELLKETWEKSRFNLRTMIVKQGDDSSTWNALAGAWNAARQGYLSTAQALGLESQIEQMCFGKVMRLMAADVAYWHRASGGQLEPDTLIWADLPAPWEVLSGETICPQSLVEDVCRKHGVDPIKKGWTAPRIARQSVPFRPTPELVHGVAVSHPEIALALRKAGWFSGKYKEHQTPVDLAGLKITRDQTGAVIEVNNGLEIIDTAESNSIKINNED